MGFSVPARRGARHSLFITALFLVLLAGAGCGPTPADLDPMDRGFVSNERGGTISVIDLRTDRVVGTYHPGGRLRGLKTSRDGRRLYVAVSRPTEGWPAGETPHDGIQELDAATGSPIALYPVGTDPEQFAVSRDEHVLYASNEDAGTASITDTASRTVVKSLVVGTEPEGVTLSPDGRWVYVTSETSNIVSVIDASLRTVRTSFFVGARPRAVAFTPDGSRAFVTAENGCSVTVVDTSGARIARVIDLPRGGNKPMGVVVAPDGGKVYVANGRGNCVAVLDARTYTLIGTIPTGKRCWGIAATRDGSKIYTANGLSNDVSVISTSLGRVIATIPAGDGPWDVAIPQG